MERKNYSKKIKENAVKLSYERSWQSTLVRELGISSTLLSKWRKEFTDYGSASFQGRGVERLTDKQRRIKDLEKALKKRGYSTE
ncbi:MAG: transposase [Phocaeicola sp.]